MSGSTRGRGVQVSIAGERELRRALRGVEGGIEDLKATHLEAAEIVRDAAEPLVPRQSGDLVGTVRAAGQARSAVVRAGKKAVPYAGVIHFGWPARDIEPQLYLYDALDDRREQVVEVYQDRVAALTKKHGIAG